MWPKFYRDYPVDSNLKKDTVEPSHGIIGCEMHDLNGWGLSFHVPPMPKKKGLIANFMVSITRYFNGRNK